MSAERSRSWVWLNATTVMAIHDRQIAEHGGLDGISSQGSVDSALAHPLNLASHGAPDVAGLAAAYAVGLVINHGFADGDKRTAWVTARLFLALNGVGLPFDPLEAVQVMETLAAGEIGEADLAAWFRLRLAD